MKIYPKLTNLEGGVGYGYQYSFSDWNAANEAIHVQAVEGDVYTAIVTDACEMQTAETQVYLEQQEITLPEPEQVLVCSGTSVDLLANENGLYYWDGNEMHQSYSYIADETDWVNLTYLDKCGSSHTVQKLVAIEEVDAKVRLCNQFNRRNDFVET